MTKPKGRKPRLSVQPGQRMLTARMPAELYNRLYIAAKGRGVSINRFAVDLFYLGTQPNEQATDCTNEPSGSSGDTGEHSDRRDVAS